MYWNSKFLLCSLGILLLLASPIAFAATQNAVVYGTVYDSAGNPLSGVDVTLENPAIGFTRNATTGSDGSYTFAEVPPAENYKLSASQAGKKIDVRSGITVNVGDERVILPPLKEQPVAANQPVETKLEAPAVTNETVSTTISGVITGDQLRSLPVAVNRNFLGLGLIPPNTHDVEQGSSLAGASFSISGNRPSSNSFLLDGADNVASSSNQAVPFQVNDSVQEFRVISGTANAEYGRNLGGTVNVVTKRGGNAFHGNAFGYFNNDALNSSSPLSVYNGTTFDKAAAYAGPLTSTFTGFAPLTYNDYVASARSAGFCTNSISLAAGPGLTPCAATPGLFGKNTFFDPASLLKANDSHKIPFDSKQFGLNMGGPFSKDKWFGFASYEGTLIKNPNPVFERVPSAFDRTYAPFGPVNFAPTNSSYVLDQKILGLFPASNVVGVPGALEFFRGQAPNYTHVHNALGRTDYIQSDKTSWSARYAMQFLNELHDDSLPSSSSYAGNGAVRDVLNQNLNLSYSHTFTPAWITEARVGFNRFRVNETPQDHNLDARTLGLPGAGLPTVLLNGIDPQYSGATPGKAGAIATWADFFTGANAAFFAAEQFPTLDYLFPFARLGAPLGAPTHRRDTTLFFADNTSWTHGKHSIKFGAEIRKLDNEYTDASFARGFMYSSNIGEFTSDSEGCNQECAANRPGGTNAFRAPSFDFYQQEQTAFATRLHSWAFGGFLQDAWRIHSHVTLNLGVRYEYFGRPEDAHDQLWNFDPTANGLVQENHTGVVDPWGQPCTPLPSYAALSAGVTNAPNINRAWTCNSSSSGVFNQITRANQNNFAPRAGLAWDVFGTGRTVVRMGGGMFYDQLPASYTAQLMYNRPVTFASGNALFGVVRDIRGKNFCPAGSFTTCGVGSAVVNPAVLNALSRDGVNPNSFYASAAEPFAIYARDTRHTATPYSMQMSASIQQQISNKLTTEIGYIGDLARKLPVIYNQNFGNEFNLFNGSAGNLTFFPVFTMTNEGSSSYHSGYFRVRAAEWHGLHLNGTYVFSKAIDNASSSTFNTLPLSLSNLSIGYGVFGSDNPTAQCVFFGVFCTIGGERVPLTIPTINFNPSAVTTTGAGQPLVTPYLLPQSSGNFLRNDRGRSDFNSTHRGVVDYTWDVPSLHKSWGAPAWMDDWQLSGVFTAQSGQPFTIFAGPIAGELNQRVNVLGPVQVSNNPSGAISVANLQLASQSALCTGPYPNATGTPGFQGNVFQPLPGTACTGNSSRNAFTGPDYINMNFAVQKGFHLGAETRMLIFRTEFYNLFDRANYFNPISTYSTDGVTVNPDFGKIKSAHEPREIQFAIRLTW